MMKNYYYLGQEETTVKDFTDTLINPNKDMSDRTFLLDDKFIICNKNGTYSSVIFNNESYGLLCNVIMNENDVQINVLCYMKGY